MPRPASLDKACAVSKTVSPCPDHPRARYWATRDHSGRPEPAEIIHILNLFSCLPKLAHFLLFAHTFPSSLLLFDRSWCFPMTLCQLKKMHNLRAVSCFIWGNMRTAAREAASQIALRDCSKAAMGEGQYIRFWWWGSSVTLNTYFTKAFLLVMRMWCHHEGIWCFSRCKDWDHKVCS